MKSNAEILMGSPAITDEYRENLRKHSESGTLQKLGDLTRTGSECNSELLSENLKGCMGVGEIRSANDTSAS